MDRTKCETKENYPASCGTTCKCNRTTELKELCKKCVHQDKRKNKPCDICPVYLQLQGIEIGRQEMAKEIIDWIDKLDTKDMLNTDDIIDILTKRYLGEEDENN